MPLPTKPVPMKSEVRWKRLWTRGANDDVDCVTVRLVKPRLDNERKVCVRVMACDHFYEDEHADMHEGEHAVDHGDRICNRRDDQDNDSVNVDVEVGESIFARRIAGQLQLPMSFKLTEHD